MCVPVAVLMREKSSYSKTSPFAITGMDNAATTSAISSHLAGSLGLSATFLYLICKEKTSYQLFLYKKEADKRSENQQLTMV